MMNKMQRIGALQYSAGTSRDAGHSLDNVGDWCVCVEMHIDLVGVSVGPQCSVFSASK